MKYILDTNILIIYIRGRNLKEYIESTFRPFEPPNVPMISVVTIGEIESFAKQNKWGIRRIQLMHDFLKQFVVVDINVKQIIEKYAEIDTFSQGKLEGRPLRMSSRNMGKNDLWIAATSSVTKATLLTTDSDFNHLNGVYLDLKKIDITR